VFSANAVPGLPSATAIWSMMPHGTPMNLFSISLAAKARSASVTEADRGLNALSVATMIAAEEESPAPTGIALST